MLKYILTTIIFFVVLFIIKIVFPMLRFRSKFSLVINVYQMVQQVIKTASEYGEHVVIAEVELEYKRYHVVCANLAEVYDELEKKCNEAIESYDKLDDLIISRNIYANEKQGLTNLRHTIRMEKWKKFIPNDG